MNRLTTESATDRESALAKPCRHARERAGSEIKMLQNTHSRSGVRRKRCEGRGGSQETLECESAAAMALSAQDGLTSDGRNHKESAHNGTRVLGKTFVEEGTGADPDADEDALRDTEKGRVKRVEAVRGLKGKREHFR